MFMRATTVSRPPTALHRASERPPARSAAAPASDRACPCGGGCPRCGARGGLQAKLAVGDSADPLEHEADRLADAALARMPETSPRWRITAATPASAPAPATAQPVLQRTGQPLETPLRRDMEQRFGADFASVRVHQDAPARQASQDLGALAWTAGEHVVFGTGSVADRQLVAHELAHVLQQRAGAAAAVPSIRRQVAPAAPAAAGGLNHVQMVSGRYVGDLPGSDTNRREDVLAALTRLNQLWSITNADHAAETASVDAAAPNTVLAPSAIPRTIAAIGRNRQPSLNDQVALTLFGITLAAPLADSRPNAKVDIYRLQDALHANWNLTNSEYGRERVRVNAGPDPVNNADIALTFEGLVRFKMAYVGGLSRRHGVLGHTGARPPQATADRDAALVTPGTATTTAVVGGVTTTTAAPFQDVVNVGGVPMTYRQDLWATMDPLVAGFYADAQTLFARPRLGGHAAGDMSAFVPIGEAAKREVDGLYGTYGEFGPPFHSGTTLLDASLRSGNAWSMISYLVDDQAELGVVRARHNADHSPGTAESAIANTFKTDYIATANNLHRLEEVDRGWPALSDEGIVSIQPFEGTTPAATRRVRWDAFQTMIHEYFHVVNHPNYYRYANQLGGDDRSVLVEGGASLMTDHAWGGIRPHIRTDAALRAQVEGQPARYSPSVIAPIDNVHYHPQFEQAQAIEAAFGRANFQAAFLTGRMELIGYDRRGPATAAGASALQRFVVPPSGVSTLADVAHRTQTTVDELAALNGLPTDAALTTGQSLLVRGMP